MKRNFPLISILIFVLVISGYGQSNSWNGLTPLRSTRADVEKLFGKSEEDKCSTCYKTAKEEISFTYSKGRCDEKWNVPPDTVLQISISPISDKGKSFEELKLDESKFSCLANDNFFTVCTNADEGLLYSFSPYREFVGMVYIPKKADNHLRCDGFPPFLPEAQYDPFERIDFSHSKFKKKDLYMLYPKLDGFRLQIASSKDYKGYILVYFDNKLPLNEYRKRLNKIKEFIFKTRGGEQITFIEGGLKGKAEIELYLVPKEMKPPAPNPALPSPQFMKKK